MLEKPDQITVPWASDGNKNNIPITRGVSDEQNKATFTQGFPQVTMTPKSSGGLPPFGKDMNGILYEITKMLQYYQAGMTYQFDSSFATAIGGYNKGALVLQNDLTGIWVSQKDNNTSNPETHGSDWLPIDNGMLTVTLSNANKALTPAQGAHPIIKLTGTLTNNIILTFPKFLQAWTIINGATGNYTVTAKTSDGSGVLVKKQTDPVGTTYHIVCDGQNILSIGADSSVRVPTGAVIPHFGTSVPQGYLLANGQGVSTTLYPELFGVLGYRFGGSGDTFNVPNLIGQFIRYGNASDVGRTVTDSIRSHTHGVTQTAHYHNIVDSGHTHSTTVSQAGGHTHAKGTMNITGDFGCEALMQGGISGVSVASGAFYNIPVGKAHIGAKVEGSNYRVAMDASRTWSGETSENGLHLHTVTNSTATSGIAMQGATANISINSTGDSETAPMHIYGMPIIKC